MVTDSIASIPREMVKQYGVRVVPINISFAGRKYLDGVDLTAGEAYRMLREKPEQFFSSPASIGDYQEVFQEIAANAGSICCVTLSSRLSGT